MHTTDYRSTFIEVAEDCPVAAAEAPPSKAAPTVAELQFAMISAAPFAHTSDDVVFGVHADRQGIPQDERAAAREAFFAKGQPCMRSSPLTKRYGWGVLSDPEGRVALVALGTTEYAERAADPELAHTRGMRSSRR